MLLSPRLFSLGCLSGFEAYSFSTGFPFSCDKNRSKIWENLFESGTQVKQFTCLGTQKQNRRSGLLFLGAVVEDVRTGFEQLNDARIYIPMFYPTLEVTT